ncbi:MAG: TVP38/TMEM64 family protein [Casimicrobium sp.]
MLYSAAMTRPLFASKKVRWFIALWLVALIAAYFFTDLRKYLTLDAVRDAQSWFMHAYEQSPVIVALAFFAIFTAISVISMPGAAALMLVAGSSFGFVYGTLLSTLASALGATIAMLLTRFFFRDVVEARYADRMKEIDRGIERNGLYYLFSLRVAPVIPYFILNWLIGLTTMRAWPFFWVSFLGMLPGTAVYVNAGNEIAKIDSMANIFSFNIVASLLLLAVAPFLLKYLLEKYNAAKHRAE